MSKRAGGRGGGRRWGAGGGGGGRRWGARGGGCSRYGGSMREEGHATLTNLDLYTTYTYSTPDLFVNPE